MRKRIGIVLLLLCLVVWMDRDRADIGSAIEPFQPLSASHCETLWADVCRLNAEQVRVGNAGRTASVFSSATSRSDAVAVQLRTATAKYVCECVDQ